MKAFVCEMCNSSDLVKDGDFFVCQSCGMKYTPEAAKKIMVEVDNTKKLTNLYERARQSISVNDLKHAAEYYGQILDENPDDWEAYFYSYLGEYVSYTNSQAPSVADKLGQVIPAAYDLAMKDCPDEEKATRIRLITEKTANRINEIASGGEYLLREYENGFFMTAEGQVNNDLYQKMRPLAMSTFGSCVQAIDKIDKKLKDIIDTTPGLDKGEATKSLLYLRRTQYTIATTIFHPNSGTVERLINAQYIMKCANKVHELDPSFVVVEPEKSIKAEKKAASRKTGCYMVVAIIGILFFMLIFGLIEL